MRAHFGGGKRDGITFGYNKPDKMMGIKCSRAMFMNQLTCLIAFAGRVKEINAQKGPSEQTGPQGKGKGKSTMKRGQLSLDMSTVSATIRNHLPQ